MNIRFYTFFFLYIVTLKCIAQILPLPGAKLNYNQVMFEYEKVKGTDFYVLQLAVDTPGYSFDHYLVEQKDSATATLIGNLQFGKKYQWRYAAIVGAQKPVWKGPFNFEIVADSLLKYNLVTVRVTQNDSAFNMGGLIINDCTHSITDRNGNLVWYLPKIMWHRMVNKRNIEIKPQIFDLRLNPSGTVTYLADKNASEIDLDGNNLWTGPDDGKVSGSNTESYNHDFKRLANGHYMVLGGEQWRKLPAYKDTAAFLRKYPSRKMINGLEYGEVEFPTVIEYDKKGNVVWSWKSDSYFDPDPSDSTRQIFELKPHVNAFSTDAKNEFVYAGFRNISRIIKIEKKTGKVVDCWGNKTSAHSPAKLVGLQRQHDANILDDGTIAVFNNNDYPGRDSFASVLLISQRPADSVNNYVAWQFACNLDSLDKHTERNGGNVDQLKNGNFLVCMGNLDRIFEVTRNKKIVWQQTFTPNGRMGDVFFHRLYRAHYISSLYPCYFVFEALRDTLAQNEHGFDIRIFNKGSEADTYQVKVTTKTGKAIKQITTANIHANRSATFEIPTENMVKAGDKIIIEVRSVTNPDLKRNALVTVSK